MTENKPKLLDQVIQLIRIRNYSLRTEEFYFWFLDNQLGVINEKYTF